MSSVDILFVTAVLPDTRDSMRNPAWSPAGSRFVLGLLSGLRDCGMAPSLVLTQRPRRRFPKSRAVLEFPGSIVLAEGLQARRIPYMNLPFLRPVAVGLYVMARGMLWGRKKGRAHERVVMVTNLTEPPGWAVLAAARLAKARAVAFVMDVGVPNGLTAASVRWRFDRWLHRRLLPRFDGLVVVRDETHERFAPRVPFVTVHAGIPQSLVDRWRQSAEGRPRQRPDRFTLAFAGALEEINGVRLMLEAMRALPGGGLALRIAGRGPLEGVVRRAAQLDPRVEYCGFLGWEELMTFYGDADLLLNIKVTKAVDTSSFFSSKLFEYMATGRPVLTTNMAQLEAEYGEVLYVLDDETVPGLVAALDRLRNTARAELVDRGLRGQRFAAENLTWERQGRRVRELIERVVRSEESAPG